MSLKNNSCGSQTQSCRIEPLGHEDSVPEFVVHGPLYLSRFRHLPFLVTTHTTILKEKGSDCLTNSTGREKNTHRGFLARVFKNIRLIDTRQERRWTDLEGSKILQPSVVHSILIFLSRKMKTYTREQNTTTKRILIKFQERSVVVS